MTVKVILLSYYYFRLNSDRLDSLIQFWLGMSTTKKKTISSNLMRILALPLVILILVVLFPIGLVYLLFDLYLRFRFWLMAAGQGKFIIFIYSDSPNWKSYLESSLFPKIQPDAVILNWSERRKWKRSWIVRAFHHWGGNKDFNPLAIVFLGITSVKTIRFHKAFLDRKHGSEDTLQEAEEKLLELVSQKTKAENKIM